MDKLVDYAEHHVQTAKLAVHINSNEAQIEVTRTYHGTQMNKTIPFSFFDSSEFNLFTELAQSLEGLLEPGAYVRRGERKTEVTSFEQLMVWLMNEGKRGMSIQRYKGLGEMNAEQLRETTMNADTRSLLRVRIEDAISADEIFTTLMGDQVEPRREFIQNNALQVGNLDI